MSLQPLAPRNVRRVNREFGTDFLTASAHHSGRWLLCMRPGGRYYLLDKPTGQMEPTEPGTNQAKWYPDGVWVPL